MDFAASLEARAACIEDMPGVRDHELQYAHGLRLAASQWRRGGAPYILTLLQNHRGGYDERRGISKALNLALDLPEEGVLAWMERMDATMRGLQVVVEGLRMALSARGFVDIRSANGHASGGSGQ